MLRRWRAAWPRRSRRFEPPWPQGTQTQPFPGIGRPAGPRPIRFPARPRRGRFVEPAWPQVPTASPPPAIADQSGPRPRFAAKLRRGRFTEPVWPQGSQAVPTPALFDEAGPRPRLAPRPRRGRFTEPPWPQLTVPAAVPPAVRATRRLAVRPPRGRFFATATPAAPIWIPATLRGRRPQPPAPRIREHYLRPPAAASAAAGPPPPPTLGHRARTLTVRRSSYLAVPAQTTPWVPPTLRGRRASARAGHRAAWPVPSTPTRITPRPNQGTTARPNSGTTPRPFAGTTGRP